MKKNNYLIITLSLALLVSLSFLSANVLMSKKNDCLPNDFEKIESFSDCVAAGNLIMETYPEQCRTADGRVFVRDVSTDEPVVSPAETSRLDSLKLASIEASNWPYTSFQDWGLELKKVGPDYSLICQASDDLQGSAFIRRNLELNDHRYCVESRSEGAVGSIYTSYVYTSLIDDFLVSVRTTVQEVNCENYDEPQKAACKSERRDFDIDALIDSLIQINFS